MAGVVQAVVHQQSSEWFVWGVHLEFRYPVYSFGYMKQTPDSSAPLTRHQVGHFTSHNMVSSCRVHDGWCVPSVSVSCVPQLYLSPISTHQQTLKAQDIINSRSVTQTHSPPRFQTCRNVTGTHIFIQLSHDLIRSATHHSWYTDPIGSFVLTLPLLVAFHLIQFFSWA